MLPHIECGELVQLLVESYSIPEIQKILQRLANGWPNRSLWSLYKKVRVITQERNSGINNFVLQWEIPIPFQSVVMNLPKGFLQDWTYIILAKYRELLSLQVPFTCILHFLQIRLTLFFFLKDFTGSIEMLRAVDVEVRNRSNQLANMQIGYKLSKLIEWEILLVDVMQLLHHWPKCANSSKDVVI